MEMPNVTVSQKKEKDEKTKRPLTVKIYDTPVGRVTEKEVRTDVSSIPWKKEYLIKDVSDYDPVKFMVEDVIVHPTYDAFLEGERWLGGDGFCRSFVGKCPFQILLMKIMGYRRLAIDVNRNRKDFESLLDVIEKKQLEINRIAAESPAEVVSHSCNINGRVTSPHLFEKYCMPYYAKAAKMFHKNDKIFMVHMDGALKSLKNLVAKTDIDIIEAFTPPPIGDLPLTEAKEAWGEKIIAANFPEPICLLGQEAVEKKTLQILTEAAPGDNFMLTITEDLEPNVMMDSLRTITETLWKYGEYPIRTDLF